MVEAAFVPPIPTARGTPAAGAMGTLDGRRSRRGGARRLGYSCGGCDSFGLSSSGCFSAAPRGPQTGNRERAMNQRSRALQQEFGRVLARRKVMHR